VTGTWGLRGLRTITTDWTDRKKQPAMTAGRTSPSLPRGLLATTITIEHASCPPCHSSSSRNVRPPDSRCPGCRRSQKCAVRLPPREQLQMAGGYMKNPISQTVADAGRKSGGPTHVGEPMRDDRFATSTWCPPISIYNGNNKACLRARRQAHGLRLRGMTRTGAACQLV